jgi:arylsulfatase
VLVGTINTKNIKGVNSNESIKHCLALLLAIIATSTTAAGDKPNILVVWGDDIGQSNISTYTHGLI